MTDWEKMAMDVDRVRREVGRQTLFATPGGGKMTDWDDYKDAIARARGRGVAVDEDWYTVPGDIGPSGLTLTFYYPAGSNRAPRKKEYNLLKITLGDVVEDIRFESAMHGEDPWKKAYGQD